MIPQIIKNRYEVTKFLGKGAFGETYLAKDLDFPNHPFRVVKILRPQSNDPDTLQIARNLFQREAEVLSKLGKDDLIPELFAYFEYNQEFYLVQEWIEGEDLTTEIYPGKKITETEVIALLKDVLTALKTVHENNVIHRDLKPSNLMRRKKDGKIVIIDFGGVKEIATTGTPLQQTIIIGTPGYFPIEQSRGYPVLASDIYAVGIMAIQALTGEFPILNDWEKQIKITPDFLKILKTMITDDLNIRYSSATQTLNAINSLNWRKNIILWLGKIIVGVGAIALFIAILSVSFNWSFRPSENQKQTPPRGWTW